MIILIVYWNASGITRKTDELVQFLQEHSIDVKLLQETQLKPYRIIRRTGRIGQQKAGYCRPSKE